MAPPDCRRADSGALAAHFGRDDHYCPVCTFPRMVGPLATGLSVLPGDPPSALSAGRAGTVAISQCPGSAVGFCSTGRPSGAYRAVSTGCPWHLAHPVRPQSAMGTGVEMAQRHHPVVIPQAGVLPRTTGCHFFNGPAPRSNCWLLPIDAGDTGTDSCDH